MKKSRFKNRKRIGLSLVALILIMLMTIGVTYSWIDDVKQIEIKTEVGGNDTPLKTGVDINAKVNVTKKNNTINLGDMIEDGDIKYDNNGKSEIKFDSNDEGNGHYFKNGEIDKKKGYFYESGDMHLSSCYSDGEHFYFKRNNSSSSYREGNKDDENVNYISFTVQVSSPYADVDFWFKSVPKVYKHGTNNAISTARYAINANGQNNVYSSDGTALTCNSDLNGTTAVSGVRKTSAYTYNNEDNTSEDQGDNSNVLFSVKKGNTINVTFKIWNQGSLDSSIAATDINLELVSSWAYTRTVRIIDRTTNSSGTSWIDDDSAKLYLTVPDFLEDRTNSVQNWNSVTATEDYSVPFWEINNSTYKSSATDSEGNTYYYYEVDVPLVFNNAEMILYRSEVWYQTSNNNYHSGQPNDHGARYWNWWRTFLPNTYTDATYTIYGSSYDETAYNRFGGTKTYKGYGTWGGVDHIQVFSHYGHADYASKIDGANFFVRDYSDEATSGEIYTYIMYRANNNTDSPWRVYLPKSSSLIQFYYYYNDSTKGTWGYKSWYSSSSYYNPQQRPLKSSGLYSANSKTYHLARNYGGDKGWGYWSNAEGVYLIKSSFLSSTSKTAHAYMFDRDTLYLKPNSNWQQSNATFKAHLWNGSSNTTVTMSQRTDDTWGINVPSGNWTNVQFQRYDSNGSTMWNKTQNLAYQNGQVFTIDSGQWGDDNNPATGSWDPWQKSVWAGETLTRLQDTSGANVSYTWNGGTTTAEVWKTDSARVFNSIIFNDGTLNNTVVGTNKTGNLDLFPGCFYQIDGDKWMGSLTDTGRSAAAESSGGSDDSGNTGTATTITTTEPASGLYAYGKLSGGSSNTEYAKFSSSLSTGTITLYLTQNVTYNFLLRYRSSNGSSWNEYANSEYNGPTLSSSTSGQTWNIDTSKSQKLKLTVNTSGYYRIKVNSISSTNATLQFDWN